MVLDDVGVAFDDLALHGAGVEGQLSFESETFFFLFGWHEGLVINCNNITSGGINPYYDDLGIFCCSFIFDF